MTKAAITSWTWSDAEGANRACAEMEQTGFCLTNRAECARILVR